MLKYMAETIQNRKIVIKYLFLSQQNAI